MTTKPMMDFEKIQNRYHLTGTLIISHATHVGCGKGNDKVDSLFVTTNGVRYIPGSSLRGALRSTSERLAASLGLETCLLEQGNNSKCPTGNEQQRKNFQTLVEKKGTEKELYKFLQDNLCLTCQVFGSPFMASRVRVADLMPLNNGNPEGRERWGVGIDRDTETAAPGILYSYQVVEKGEKFHFELWAENMSEQAWAILGLGLMELITGNFWVGAKSAAGLGQCCLEEASLKLEYFSDTEGLKKYLAEGKFQEEEPKEQIKSFFQKFIEKLLEDKAGD